MTAPHLGPMAEQYRDDLARRQHVDDRPFWIVSMSRVAPDVAARPAWPRPDWHRALDEMLTAVGATTVLRGPILDPDTVDAIGQMSIMKFARAADLLALSRLGAFADLRSTWLAADCTRVLLDVGPLPLPPSASPVARPAHGDIVDLCLWRFGHPEDAETFLDRTRGIAARYGAGYDGWFEVRNHLVSEDTWDELVVTRYPDLGAREALHADPTWQEASTLLVDAATAHDRAVVAPVVNVLSTSVDIESASLFDA